MNIFIYFHSALPCAIGDLEDDFQDRISDFGEVTGSGIGRTGSNIDLEMSGISPEQALQLVLDMLVHHGIHSQFKVVIDGQTHSFE